MAFQNASGWNNLPNGVFVPEIYSQKVQKFFRRAAVVEAITNTDYYGEIAEFGDTVHIIKEPTITVAPYARGTQVLTQDLADDEITLQVDQAFYFGFKVDDIEAKQAHLNWEDLSTSSGAYSLKDNFDAEVLAYMIAQVPTAGQFGTTGAPKSIVLGFATGITPLQILNRHARLLDENNVPTENRWCVAPPIFWEYMRDENSAIIGIDWQSTGAESSLLRNGRVSAGKIRNFDCYQSNNVPLDSSGQYQILTGHMSSTATASQIAQVEKLRDPNSFADIVRGMHMYGRKVLRTNAMMLTHTTFS